MYVIIYNSSTAVWVPLSQHIRKLVDSHIYAIDSGGCFSMVDPAGYLHFVGSKLARDNLACNVFVLERQHEGGEQKLRFELEDDAVHICCECGNVALHTG